jgi:nodulation protein E
MRRVAITGIGVVSAIGHDREAFWRALSAGQSGIAPITSVDCSALKIKQGAEVRGFDPSPHIEPKQAAHMDRSAQLAIAAAAEALAESQVEIVPERKAAILGCCIGGKVTDDTVYRELYQENRTRFDPLTIPRIMANASASWISMRHGIKGPCYTVSTACASAAHAIGQALWLIRNGVVDVALAGGNEAPFTLGMLRGWEAMRVVAPDTCRPFSLQRKGLILGEGAAVLVLEPLESALARGTHVYAELAGFGMTSDAGHLTMPSADGAARAMRAALTDAALAPEQVTYINAHGTGTAANDSTETRAIHDVFARTPLVSSTKSMHGHTLGAAGALEAAATVLSLDRGLLPPTINFLEPDPECDLDVIPNSARAFQAEAALSNSFAFGGLNAVLAFRAVKP